jgi:DNA-directed RNA polymerase specialized sigma24 family protein
LSGSNPAQVTAFISTLARNGLVDHLRSPKTSRRVSLEDGWEGARSIQAVARTAPSADLDAERREFAGALRDCVMQLTPRARLVWFLRVFHELPSATIGAHPEVRMKPPTIDVTLARCRARLVRCMQKRGFVPHDAPPGVFAFLWEVVRLRSADDA